MTIYPLSFYAAPSMHCRLYEPKRAADAEEGGDEFYHTVMFINAIQQKFRQHRPTQRLMENSRRTLLLNKDGGDLRIASEIERPKESWIRLEAAINCGQLVTHQDATMTHDDLHLSIVWCSISDKLDRIIIG